MTFCHWCMRALPRRRLWQNAAVWLAGSRRGARRMALRARAGAPLAGATLLAALAAPALADVAPARVVYVAPAECPGVEAFLDAVRAQTPNARAPGEDEPARTLAVHVDRDQGQLRGRLTIDELDGRKSVREVSGKTCEEVVSAIALVTALAIDAGPDAIVEAPPAPPATTARPGPTAPPPAPAQRDPPAPVAPAAPVAPITSTTRWEFGVQSGAFGAVAPNIAWGGLVFLEMSEWNQPGFAYSFRAALTIAQSPTFDSGGGDVSFQWTAVRLSGCPLALLVGPITARPCVGLDAGSLLGRGTDLPTPLQATRAWVAATFEGRAALLTAGRFVIEAGGGLTVPLIRDTFVFQSPARIIHQVPQVGGFGTAGVGVTFQ